MVAYTPDINVAPAEVATLATRTTGWMKMGPNDARHFVWAISTFFFTFCLSD